MTADITMTPREVAVTFTPPFDLASYATFLRCKALPESEISYVWQTDTYTLTAPARYAPVVDGSLAAPTESGALPYPDSLFDYQAAIVSMALAARRWACWADTGLGKTRIFLEWARQVRHRTDGRVLILSPLAVIPQTVAEAARWYGEGLPVTPLATREDLAAWCLGEGPSVGICNYEKLIPGILPELRHLDGLVADEASILKTGAGKIKWNLIKSARGIPYKLSCTATPAPNDAMEYASQASFLEKLRTEGEILWTFFSRDKSGEWSVKPHARIAFYRFLASWSIYVRDPAHYGWQDVLADLPPPVYHEERIALTPEQAEEMSALQVRFGTGFFGQERMGVQQRTRFAQLARGFLYPDKGAGTELRRIPSLKPAAVADIVRAELAAGRPVIVWTVFDEESAILADLLTDLPVALLHGDMSATARADSLTAFQTGAADVLITKAQLAGYGLNLQRCRAMVFSGIDDSFERLYQAVRRAYRYGQTDPVQVHTPLVPELEGMIFDNVRAKEVRFMADVTAMEAAYIAAREGTPWS